MTCLSEKVVKTRKPHECFLCGDLINIGERVVASVNSCDGKIYTLHAHQRCLAFAKEYCTESHGWGGDFWCHDIFKEEVDEFYEKQEASKNG